MSIFLKVGANHLGRDFIVGDIHGHLSQLDDQLGEVAFNSSRDRLFCLGDLVDRGADSEALLARIDQETYFSILGNHEAMMITGITNLEVRCQHQANGGKWFYRLPLEARQQLLDQVRSWPWAIELDTGTKKLGLIHANALSGSWPRTVNALSSISEIWQSGASLHDNHAIKTTAEQLLWDRSLAKKLYCDLLEMGIKKRKISEYKSIFMERLSLIGDSSFENLAPFNIDGIDALYLGHNFVPRAITVGNCHFLDSYRGNKDERLSLVCVNSPP